MIEIRETLIFSKWLESLRDRVARARIQARIIRLGLGNPGDVKSVGDGILEMRIDHGPGYRVYFIQKGAELIILLAGGDKSTQSKDIKKAIELADDL
jgi:putative addiction module killer protein